MRFEKVSQEQFLKDCLPIVKEAELAEEYWNGIILPKRSTMASAGYDFRTPFPVKIPAGKEVLIPTGICALLDNDKVLMIFPRSGMGFKYGIRLMNTVGIIDADYYHAENEGHIMVKMKNPSETDISLSKGEKFCQGVILPYFTMDDDDTNEIRRGGFGSTGK